MNYTNNYRLPQWEKSDRILMEDFNDAMVALDAAIKNAASGAAAGQTTAEARIVERLKRLGYDLCQTNARSIAAGASPGLAKGLAYNGLTSAEEIKRTSGFLYGRTGGGRLGPGTLLTAESILSGAELNTGTIALGQMTEPTSILFHSNGRGTITRLSAFFKSTDHSATVDSFTMKLTLYDMADGREIYTVSSFTPVIPNGTKEVPFDAAVPLEPDRDYKMEIKLIEGYKTYNGTFRFGDASGWLGGAVIDAERCFSGRVQETAAPDSPACAAAAVVHYSGGNAVPTLKVNGQTMSPAAVRQGVSVRGDACTEQEYYLEGNWTGTVPLTADFSAETKDMSVYDVEFYLI